jgi:hypothetical protein
MYIKYHQNKLMNKIPHTILAMGFLLTLTSCKTYKTSVSESTAAFYNYEVQHVASGEGTETLKVYSYAKNEKEGVDQGKLNAIRAIIFKGIPGADFQKPLVAEVGAEEKYKSYFNEFLKPNGKYLKFIALASSNLEVLKAEDQLKVGLTVTIQKDNLRKELEAANIIKPLTNGF